MYVERGDKEIIGKVLRGDKQFFAELVKRYQDFVFTVALRYTNNRQDAEDIAQDVFLKAYRSLAGFRHNSKFSTWLYAITVNTCSSFLRKKKIETHSMHDDKIFEQLTALDPEYNSSQRSNTHLVNKVVGLLHPDDALIITLFYKGEQSVDEVAQILGITINNVKVKLHRARQRLKEKLETVYPEEFKEMIH
jgi:RNA polymerase sigma-70 factor (ECF subfamily)